MKWWCSFRLFDRNIIKLSQWPNDIRRHQSFLNMNRSSRSTDSLWLTKTGTSAHIHTFTQPRTWIAFIAYALLLLHHSCTFLFGIFAFRSIHLFVLLFHFCSDTNYFVSLLSFFARIKIIINKVTTQAYVEGCTMYIQNNIHAIAFSRHYNIWPNIFYLRCGFSGFLISFHFVPELLGWPIKQWMKDLVCEIYFDKIKWYFHQLNISPYEQTIPLKMNSHWNCAQFIFTKYAMLQLFCKHIQCEWHSIEMTKWHTFHCFNPLDV